jgi:hypothetical protein
MSRIVVVTLSCSRVGYKNYNDVDLDWYRDLLA